MDGMIRKLESISPANIAMALGVGIAAETIAQPETIAMEVSK